MPQSNVNLSTLTFIKCELKNFTIRFNKFDTLEQDNVKTGMIWPQIPAVWQLLHDPTVTDKWNSLNNSIVAHWFIWTSDRRNFMSYHNYNHWPSKQNLWLSCKVCSLPLKRIQPAEKDHALCVDGPRPLWTSTWRMPWLPYFWLDEPQHYLVLPICQLQLPFLK